MTKTILHPLLALLACATRRELARQVAYLKEENRILRARLPKRIVATPAERRRLVLPVRFAELVRTSGSVDAVAGSESTRLDG